MNKALMNIILIITACIVLYFISRNLIIDKKLLTLEYNSVLMASSTPIASSTIVVSKNHRNAFDFPSATILVPKGSIKVFLAENNIDQEQGLSGINELPQAVGALFVFANPGKYGFWMKDMNFPLDLIWINKDKKIIGVTKNALPSSYPFVFMPPNDVSYVLEMNAGSVIKFGLTTGSSLDFSL